MERLYQQIGQYALLLALGDGDVAPMSQSGLESGRKGLAH
jgi:hypothetical protein